MSYMNKTRGLKVAAMILMTAVSASSWAQSNIAPTGGGSDFGAMFRNLTSGLGSLSGLIEALMYITGAVFALITIFKLYKWNKSDGRDATLGGIGVTFLVAILGFTMPMMINSGATQLWGSGTLKTVTPPPAFR